MNHTTPLAKIGFVGFGRRSVHMARAAAQAGWPLHVWAGPNALRALGDTPFHTFATPDELGAVCDIVVLCQPDDDAVESIVTNGRLIASMRPDAIVVDHTKGSPQAAARAANHGSAFGVHVLDAPVQGQNADGKTRRLTAVVGGDSDAYARTQPLLESYCAAVRHAGVAGSGQRWRLNQSVTPRAKPGPTQQMVSFAAALAIR